MYDLVTMRRPVLNSRTLSVQRYFGEDCFRVLRLRRPGRIWPARSSGVHADPERRGGQLVARAAQALEPYRWPNQQKRYLGYVEQALAA